MLLDYLRGRPALPNPAPEVTPAGEGAYRVALGGEAPVTVTAAPVSLDADRNAPGEQVVAFALSAVDARGAVTARLTVGPARVMQNYLVHQGYVEAASKASRMGGLKGVLYDILPPSEPIARRATVPLVVAVARAAAHLAAARGAGTLLVVRAWIDSTDVMGWRPAEATLDAAYTAAGFRFLEPESLYGYSTQGALWMRRGAPARRGRGAPGFVVPLSRRDAAWVDGMERACRALLQQPGGDDDGVEAALNTVARWRQGLASGPDVTEAEQALHHRLGDLQGLARLLGLAALNVLAVILHREARLGEDPLYTSDWYHLTGPGRRALQQALERLGESREEARAHVDAWLGE